jgi:DNA (cytosine-5)-methyltransferase 1
MAIHPHSTIYHVDLCSGSGMLGLAVRIALAGQLRTVAYVEREAYAAAALVARMADQALDQAPIWDDVTAICEPGFREIVEGLRPLAVTAGFPCQPFSLAGKRLGTSDERHLWPFIAEFIGRVRPECVFLENVPGLVSARTIHHRKDLCEWIDGLDRAAQVAGTARQRWRLSAHRDRLYRRLLKEYGISVLHYVLCDLERMGYRVQAGLYSALEVGASHKRERLFILALADADGDRGLQCAGAELQTGGTGLHGTALADAQIAHGRQHQPQRSAPGGTAAGGPGAHVADATAVLGETFQRSQPDGVLPPLADAGQPGSQGAEWDGASGERFGPEASGSAAEFRLPLFAPGPFDLEGWERCLALDPTLEPSLCRMADELASGVDANRLRLAGNGVVPLAAAYAFVSLWAALEYGEGAGSLVSPTQPTLFKI